MTRVGVFVVVVGLLFGSGPWPADATTFVTGETFVVTGHFFRGYDPIAPTATTFSFVSDSTACAGVGVQPLVAPGVNTGPCSLAFGGDYFGTCFRGTGLGTGSYNAGERLNVGVVVRGTTFEVSGWYGGALVHGVGTVVPDPLSPWWPCNWTVAVLELTYTGVSA